MNDNNSIDPYQQFTDFLHEWPEAEESIRRYLNKQKLRACADRLRASRRAVVEERLYRLMRECGILCVPVKSADE